MNKLDKYFMESYRDFHGEGFSTKGVNPDKHWLFELESKFINDTHLHYADLLEIAQHCVNVPSILNN